MIVPMKKVSLIVLSEKKEDTLKKLRRLGLMEIQITETSNSRVQELHDQIGELERCLFGLDSKAVGNAPGRSLTPEEALAISRDIDALDEERQALRTERSALQAELTRLQPWGEVDPAAITACAQEGIPFDPYEIPTAMYDQLGEEVTTLCLERGKATVKCLIFRTGADGEEEALAGLNSYRLQLPEFSTEQLRQKIAALDGRMSAIEETITGYAANADGIRGAIHTLEKELEFEIYATGMPGETLPADTGRGVAISYFQGYLEAENLDRLKEAARENAWGLLAEDPTPEDNTPTKLKNNKLVSLIYPVTDFLGTVPGYFEFDISGWFLVFLLIFFGIIFGDGGYGLLILAVAGVMAFKDRSANKAIAPTTMLVALFGLSTVVWGFVTCSWFGITPSLLPQWLQKMSVPVLSNVYSDRIWYPFGPDGGGLTTSQNVQIFCFALALVQLSIAHLKCAVRDRHSLKILGDIGSVFQLVGIFYLVLSLVVNPAVFPMGLVVGGIPVGNVAVALIGVGFLMAFVFSNFEGNILKSILASLTNIVSMLLGVVNVFSDIVSYIRLWAVGLAGAAFCATVNDMAVPCLGNFMFVIVAIILLVFGHGLNMILNVLSVVVHGIRLNTLEFSSHLDMSWSGHKFQPFYED